MTVLAAIIVLGALPRSDAPDLSARLERIGEYLRNQREADGIPGLSAAVVYEHRLAWSDGFGIADVENNVPATARTVYRIGGITRTITAVAVLQLVEAGRLSLFESIRNFAPEFPDKESAINIRHILAHLSGIRPPRPDELLNRKPYQRLVDSLEPFAKDPLLAKPGERFINSSFAYNLAGLVLERVSGQSYGDYLRDHVFARAEMTSSALDRAEPIVPNRAAGYRRREGSLQNSPFVDLSGRYPADGVISTAEDLARFAIAFQTNKLLSPEMVQVMTTVHKTASGSDEKYGLGCFVRSESGRRIVGHGGWVPQASAFLLMLPDQRSAVVILTNLEQVDVAAISTRVASLLLD